MSKISNVLAVFSAVSGLELSMSKEQHQCKFPKSSLFYTVGYTCDFLLEIKYIVDNIQYFHVTSFLGRIHVTYSRSYNTLEIY